MSVCVAAVAEGAEEASAMLSAAPRLRAQLSVPLRAAVCLQPQASLPWLLHRQQIADVERSNRRRLAAAIVHPLGADCRQHLLLQSRCSRQMCITIKLDASSA